MRAERHSDRTPPSTHVEVRPLTVVAIRGLDAADVAALDHARRMRAEETVAVHFERDAFDALELEATWTALGLEEFARLEIVRSDESDDAALVSFVRSIPDRRHVDVIVPARSGAGEGAGRRERKALTDLSMALLRLGRGRVTLLPVEHHDDAGWDGPQR